MDGYVAQVYGWMTEQVGGFSHRHILSRKLSFQDLLASCNSMETLALCYLWEKCSSDDFSILSFIYVAVILFSLF